MSRTLINHVHICTADNTLADQAIWIEQGHITQITPAVNAPAEGWEIIQANHAWAIPAFIDLHIHGMNGFGLQSADDLLQLSLCLARQGVGAFCPTLYCAKPSHMQALLQKLTPALGQETGARVVGFHLEGPFISPHKPGVMKPEDIAPANLADFERLFQAAQGKIALVTLAPEVPGIDPIIYFCQQHHIVMQAGHTNATYEQMQEAFTKGITRVTHWGNAMSAFHHRAPGVMGAALFNPHISCEVIADGVHVHPALLNFLRQVKPVAHISAVTDALVPTGQPNAPFMANNEEVVLDGGVWKRKSDGVIAGSALTMLRAYSNLIKYGYSMQQAVMCTSTSAATLLKLDMGTIAPNQLANMVLLSPEFALQYSWIQGKQVI